MTCIGAPIRVQFTSIAAAFVVICCVSCDSETSSGARVRNSSAENGVKVRGDVSADNDATSDVAPGASGAPLDGAGPTEPVVGSPSDLSGGVDTGNAFSGGVETGNAIVPLSSSQLREAVSANQAQELFALEIAGSSFALLVTDKPWEGVLDQLELEVLALRALGQGGTKDADIPLAHARFDLAALTDARTSILGNAKIAAGRYRGIEFSLKSEAFLSINGVAQELHIPADTLRVLSPFDVSADGMTAVVLDFVPEQSLVQTKPGIYTLKPSIHTKAIAHIREGKSFLLSPLPIADESDDVLVGSSQSPGNHGADAHAYKEPKDAPTHAGKGKNLQ